MAAPEEEEMLVKPFRYFCGKHGEEPCYKVQETVTIATFRKDNHVYHGCPKEGCRKKMTSNDARIPECPNHGMQGNVNKYYSIRIKVHADDDELWLKFFNNHMKYIHLPFTKSVPINIFQSPIH